MSEYPLYMDSNLIISRSYIKASGNIWNVSDAAGFEARYDRVYTYTVLFPVALMCGAAVGLTAYSFFKQQWAFMLIMAAVTFVLWLFSKYLSRKQKLYLLHTSGKKINLNVEVRTKDVSMLKYALEAAKLPEGYIGKIWEDVSKGQPLSSDALTRLKPALKAGLA